MKNKLHCRQKPVLSDQQVTIENLERFKSELLSSIKQLVNENNVDVKRKLKKWLPEREIDRKKDDEKRHLNGGLIIQMKKY